MEDKDLREAKKLYLQAYDLNPRLVQALYNTGLVQMRRGKVNSAMVYFRWVLQKKPRHSRAYNNLAVCLSRQGKISEAIEHYERAIRYNRTFADAYVNLAILLVKCGDHLAAYKNFRYFLEQAGAEDPDREAARELMKSISRSFNSPSRINLRSRRATAI